ncbi:tol-pal system protein YbgF [Limnohabitans sp. MORI2]|uniref:tol-pal system protein YbgF n=1 Tax=Limnohabitans sp. MORI2 TaxID=1751150 RepID=UPI0023777B45|nr:tol-pal system protein YbgF [Limnohabitans sp. MORI2]BDU58256.1 tol-pal system protein YbgF [Limnohabitans sp. MORI2]
MKLNTSFSLRAVALAAAVLASVSAQAALFEDEEARRAILDLRQRVERQGEEIQNFQRSLLEQQNQFEALRAETARLRGEKEELTQELRRAQELSQGVDDRLKKFEPAKVKVDGVEFVAEPAETKAYEDALAIFRKGEFGAASMAFNDFIKRNPKSGYVVPSLFWLGNAQYANRDYTNAIKNFNTLLAKAPSHMRAADAMLSVANCQLDLKDIKAARKTLAEVVKAYPHTEAAAAASERLAKLK